MRSEYEDLWKPGLWYLVLDDYGGGSWITQPEPPQYDPLQHFGKYRVVASGSYPAMLAAQRLLEYKEWPLDSE